MFVGRWSFQTVVRQGGSPLRMRLTVGGSRSSWRPPPTVFQRGEWKQKTRPHTANTDFPFFQDRFWRLTVLSCGYFFFFFFVETITTVSLLTFYSNKLVALLILMACCNPISGDLSSFLMARHHISASYGPLQTRTHTRCHPTRHNEHSSAAPPLCPAPAPASVWLYVKWYILSY